MHIWYPCNLYNLCILLYTWNVRNRSCVEIFLNWWLFSHLIVCYTFYDLFLILTYVHFQNSRPLTPFLTVFFFFNIIIESGFFMTNREQNKNTPRNQNKTKQYTKQNKTITKNKHWNKKETNKINQTNQNNFLQNQSKIVFIAGQTIVYKKNNI